MTEHNTINLSVGYTDALVGLLAWPLTSAAWTVVKKEKGASIEVHITMQPAGLLPTEAQAGNAARAGAAETAERFAAIWYQIQQPDVTAELSTSLQQTGTKPDVLPLKMDGLHAYMTSAYSYATQASEMTAAYADRDVTSTLEKVVTHYGLDWQLLGLAAGERLLGHLVDLTGKKVMIPSYAVVTAGSTPDQLVPSNLDVTTVLEDRDNSFLPLQPGTELQVPEKKYQVGSDKLPPAALAREFGLTLASLVRGNEAVPALLRPGFVFFAEGVEVEIPPVEANDPTTDATLNQVADAFRAAGVPFDAVMATGANKDKPGMFREGANLIVNRRVIQQGWTLEGNGTGFSKDKLAPLNKDTTDLFPAGTPLFLEAAEVAGLENAPLGSTARAYGIEAGDLLRHNAGLAPKKTVNPDGDALTAVGLPIPGLAGPLKNPPAQLPSTGDGYSPAYLADQLHWDPTLVLAANTATPGLILAGVELAPGLDKQPTLKTAEEDSLNAVIGRFAALGHTVTVADLVQGNETTDFLAPGAALLSPPAETILATTIGASGWQFPDTIFPLFVGITLSRNKNLVDPAFKDTDVVATTSIVPAQRGPTTGEDGAETLTLFADTLASAIPGLELVTGQLSADGQEITPTDLVAVWFLPESGGPAPAVGISQIKITAPAPAIGDNGPQPFSFALRPLSNTLESAGDVQIGSLDPETGLLNPEETRAYQGIDLEDWAQAWLAGLDLLCTGPYATSAYQVNPDALERLLAAKQTLADAVADGLSAILAEQDATAAIGSSAWKAARELLRERLLSGLEQAYDSTGVVQFQAGVTAAKDVANVRLSGTGELADGHTNERTTRLGNARLSLETADAASLSFPFSMSRPTQESSVSLTPTYAVKEIEYQITQVTHGYSTSQWAQFVRNFNEHSPNAYSADLGTPIIPVPLRSYPSLPALVSQSAQTPKDASTIEEALYWAYRFTVAHQSAAQDQLLIAAEFNRVPPDEDNKPEPLSDTLFNALAQYSAIEDPLWGLLDQLKKPDGNDNSALAAALGTYAQLAERVSKQWALHWGVVGGDEKVRPANQGLIHPARRGPTVEETGPAPHQIHTYLISLETRGNSRLYDALTLTPQGSQTLVWPEITVFADGIEIPLKDAGPLREVWRHLKPGKTDTRRYRFPSKARVPMFSQLRLQFTFPGLNISTYQNATAAVSVVRNARLLGAGGPETCSSFFYRTPELAFPEPLAPLIAVPQRLVLGTWTKDPTSHPLYDLLKTVFDGDFKGRDIAFAISYGYTLAEGDPPLKTYIPVALHPRMTVNSNPVPDIIEMIQDWKNKVDPISTGGQWRFGLSLYSTVSPYLERPLLELKQLVVLIASE